MSDVSDEDKEISFSVKFLGRVEVLRPDGMQILTEAWHSLKTPERDSTEKLQKKSKVCLFLSGSSIDILEHKSKFMLYTCPLLSVSFCGVLPSSPKVLGFVARHPAADSYHCYLLQSSKFTPLLVSIIGDAFLASQRGQSIPGGQDMVVEALRHKNKVLQRENAELKKRLAAQAGEAH
ncbi:PTB domain-containing engulfment adapter protein 1-like [Hypomesus transpacificus]|uniref:PTB domain-containing engulfment adapter protein 1-like n=1 Tax=Hypomesus transpacificus TaxID=137520 RepID=UPI001F084BCB|nr:PTB domain-containing engulfment adapter protein 1-like [Hypomesus transpacificus]XP_046890402.1 PTB domain-containing engulfment adapter protein 1-like [Hypomesus transpacificus]